MNANEEADLGHSGLGTEAGGALSCLSVKIVPPKELVDSGYPERCYVWSGAKH